MKLVVLLLFVTAFAHATFAEDVVENEEENNPALAAAAEISDDAGDSEIEATLGEQGISESVIHLPTVPQGIESGPAWECIPRRLYRQDCNICICNRNRQLKCRTRNCDLV